VLSRNSLRIVVSDDDEEEEETIKEEAVKGKRREYTVTFARFIAPIDSIAYQCDGEDQAKAQRYNEV
jgi:hypothetical protein